MFFETLRRHRELFGLTQAKLSMLSGVSLPTIQNIEAGRANPELETIQKLLHVLGMETQFVAKSVDWDFLSSCGVPLRGYQTSLKAETGIPFLKTRFIEQMRLALLECNSSDTTERDRKSKAIGATLLALQTHYPSVFADFSDSELAKKLLSQKGLQKLRRIALTGLMRFL